MQIDSLCHVYLCVTGLAADVLPLLAAGLLPGATDGHGVGRGVQGGAARAAVPSALYVAAAAHHGLRKGTGPLADYWIRHTCTARNYIF